MIVILYTSLCQKKKPSSVPFIFRKVVSTSPFSPFLALKIPFVQEIIKYQAREVDLLLELLLDGVMESVNQLILVLCFAVYINKTGLDISNVISIITNSAGFIFKLAKVVHIYFKKRKAVKKDLLVDLTAIPHSLQDTTVEEAPSSTSSVEVINIAFHADIATRADKIGK